MKDELSIEGNWWLPDSPDNKVFGKMSFVPGNILNLKLQGIINAPPKWNNIKPPDFIEPTIIQGFGADEGRKITLYKCQQLGYSFSGMHTTSFIGEAAFIGAHLESEEEVKFKKISVRFSNIEEWANKRPFTSEYEDGDWKKQVFRYEHPNSVIATTDDFDVHIVFYGPNVSGFGSSNQLSISYETRVEIISQNEEPFEKYLTVIRRVQNFFGLAMGVPTFPIAITGFSSVNKETQEDGADYPLPIDIYYLVAGWPEELKEHHYFQMLFTLQTIEEEFEPYLQNWMKKYDYLEPAINLYFSVLYNPHSYVEVRFLSLAQAIETYHRRVFEGDYQSREKFLADIYPQLVEAIPDNLQEDFKNSIKGRLQYLNEYSLRKRLGEIIKSVKQDLDFAFVQSRKGRELFIAKVVDTRNYWTHYSPELADKAAQPGEERLMLITKLQLLLEVRFMKELDFKTELIRDLIKHSQNYRLLKSRKDE